MKVETTVFQFTIKCNKVYKEARCVIKTLRAWIMLYALLMILLSL